MLTYADICCVRAFSVSVSQCCFFALLSLHLLPFRPPLVARVVLAVTSAFECLCALVCQCVYVIGVSMCLCLTGLHACMSGSCMNPKVNDDLIALVVRGMCELKGCQHHLDVAHCNKYDTFWPHVPIDTNI
jgi:hypothetical protein